MARNSQGKGFIVGTLLGGVLGGLAALLFAPKSGEKFRKDISEKCCEASDKACTLFCNVSEQAKDIVEKAKCIAEDAKNAAQCVIKDMKNKK